MFLRSPPPAAFLFLLLLSISAVRSLHASDQSRKLDESVDQSKCGGCPCSNPCPTPTPTPTTYPPPPPPPPILPPPPPKKTPYPGRYCPPPPSQPSGFIYITAPPGSLYPVDQSYNGATRRSSAAALWIALVALFIGF